jgi:signal transduction histidine kinase
MMQNHTILLVSDDAALCATARHELEARVEGLRVAAVSTVEAAHGIVEDAAPAVILLDEALEVAEPWEHREQGARLESAVSALVAYAPVVVIGPASHEGDLAPLVTAGVADFVVRSAESLPKALGLVEQRLRQAPDLLKIALPYVPLDNRAEAFGEVFRHELNNPLTGILGNAELLLAEVRRKNDGQLPNGGQKRLETIAALAVRLRETVRRLSEDWESRNRMPQSSAQPRTAH